MSQAKRAGDTPEMIDIKTGKNYAWCSCGMSENQPWCNGSHKTTDMTPFVFQAEGDKTVAICMCKQTSNPPFCDGSHAKS